eukprot:scaffold3158_cov389-Prasinococcus_capsulatus_cf.AAC.12
MRSGSLALRCRDALSQTQEQVETVKRSLETCTSLQQESELEQKEHNPSLAATMLSTREQQDITSKELLELVKRVRGVQLLVRLPRLVASRWTLALRAAACLGCAGRPVAERQRGATDVDAANHLAPRGAGHVRLPILPAGGAGLLAPLDAVPCAYAACSPALSASNQARCQLSSYARWNSTLPGTK